MGIIPRPDTGPKCGAVSARMPLILAGISIAALVAIVLILGVFPSGNDTGNLRQPASKIETGDYFPLAVGSTWHYRIGASGGLKPESRGNDEEYEIASFEEYKGRKCYRLICSSRPEVKHIFYSRKPDGIYSLHGTFCANAMDFDTPFLELPSMLEKDASFEWVYRSFQYLWLCSTRQSAC